MFIKILRGIPFIIPIISASNIIIVIFSKYINNWSLLIKVNCLLFNFKTPFYFNYWIIYTMISAIISVFLLLTDKYTKIQSIIAIGINVFLCVVILKIAVFLM